MVAFTPSTPDPETTVLVAALIRHVLTILGAIGVYHGAASDSVISIVAGAIVAIAGICWSIWQKYQAAKLDHEGNVKSVVDGKPMRAM